MSAAGELRAVFRMRALQLGVLTLLLGFVAWRAMELKFSVADLDVWWHVQVGQRIVDHHAFPHTGILSRTAADRPWSAYSWGYEVPLSRSYAWFGLVGVGLYGTLLTIMVAYAVYWMSRRLSGSFWIACALATISCSAFLFNLMPRPVFFSMTLFAVTLTLLLESQRTGRVQTLYWLPLVCLIWANCHIQFVYGMAVIGMFVGVHVLQELARRIGIGLESLAPSRLPAARLVLILAACVLTTCIGPYTYHLYVIAFTYAGSKFPYTFIREFQALNFRAISHYVELLLAGAAFFALGRRKRVDPFKLALLTVTSVIAFRTMRDSWFLCIAAAACIADSCAVSEQEAEETGAQKSTAERGETLLENGGLAAALAVLILLFARNTDFNPRGLDDAMSSVFPVRAVNFLRANPQPGLLYNTFDWGGFLTWYNPQQPVAIDGRTDLYGDDIDTRFFKTQNGDDSYKEDPYFNDCRVILLSKKMPLASVLLSDPRYTLVFQDSLSVVFVRQ
jgi:hypothetical protein